ncbi:MAG: aldehyde dehydrogenase family protein, partial [Pseudomonadota bacterium]
MRDERRFYIDGGWTAPLDGRDLDVIDPSTEEAFATISLGGEADADAAVAAAKRAFPAWARTSREDRLDALERLKAAYDALIEEMAEIISLEMGAPIALAKAAQAAAGSGHLAVAIETLRTFDFEHDLGPNAPGSRILKEPIGVCALITPWNWPMNQVVLKVAPALAAGCTVVLKPSEVAPMSSHLFAEMVDAA